MKRSALTITLNRRHKIEKPKFTLAKFFLILVITSFASFQLYAQGSIQIDGSILISQSEDANPQPGTIRYNAGNSDFEAWNGYFWASLTGFQTGTVSDIDGNVYKTAVIGEQTWMIENLKTTRYRDGSLIPLIDDSNEWSITTEGAYSYYRNNIINDSIYGKLYNWYAVSTQELCPDGWKVPFEIDWDNLIDHLGGEVVAGKYLKEVGTTHWYFTSPEVTNASAFTSIGGGSRVAAGNAWMVAGEFAYYWALTVGTTASGIEGAFSRILRAQSIKAESFVLEKNNGFSVRCIKTN